MSKYTTGEMAKLCGVSVRTVQYYDAREILTPSELTEGGRRLYSDDDLKRLKIICFLRDAGLPIHSISWLLHEEDPGSVIDLLLDQQEQMLKKEQKEVQDKLTAVEQIRRELKGFSHFSVESIGDIASIMTTQKELRKLRWQIIATGIVMEIIEGGTAILWWKTDVWWPFALGMCLVIALGLWISLYYFNRVAYICPQCHEVFQPAFQKALFAYHTPRTRRLTCPRCGRRSFCVEVYAQKSSAL